jgi:hypothetical protein
MITFFRRIRQNLLPENKVSRYLLYAIGEIALVMIGILLALQVNNWNEEKKAKDKERQALSEILSDLELNISSLRGIIYTDRNNITTCTNSVKLLITNLEETKVYHDSLSVHFSNSFRYPDLDLKSSGYESLTSIGMDMIEEQDVRSAIGKYYTYTIPGVKAAYKELRDDFYNYMLYFLRTEFRSIGLELDQRIDIPFNYDALINNKVYLESLKTYLSVFDYYNREAKNSLDETEKLRQHIEAYLSEK